MKSQIRPESPRDPALTNPQPLAVKDVQTRLVDRDSVLLQYFLGSTHSYVWAVTTDRVTACALPGRAEIERHVRLYREALSHTTGPRNASAVSTCAQRVRAEALTLSRLLLGPVASALDRPRVLILPDGILQLLPFAALPDPHSQSKTADGMPLIVQHEVVHLPSASTLALVRSQWTRDSHGRKPVVVFADPVFEADDPRIGAVEKRASFPSQTGGSAVPRGTPTSLTGALRDLPDSPGGGIPRLLGSYREASGIKAVAPGADVHLGFDASRSAATSADVANYRIVHFATHGIVNDRHPELSGVILSLFDRNGRPQDGYLRLHDIFTLRLPVDLVVLSACSTALGKDVLGEGLIGLVRGFMSAGSRRVIASLWKVDDEATSELMTRFYRGLFDKGLTPPAALRAAQVELLTSSRWGRPFYWAAFVLQGEWN